MPKQELKKPSARIYANLQGIKIAPLLKTVVMHKSNHSSNKGGSRKSILPKENRPENQPEEGKPREEKLIGIGMPMSEEEMKKLKEDAKKMDR